MTDRPFFWIYMLECENGSYYTGCTTDLARRFKQHIDGTANVRYTRAFKPVRIAQCWRLREPVGLALKIERLIKSVGRGGKERLVRKPVELKRMAGARLGLDLDIAPSDPAGIEKTARRLP